MLADDFFTWQVFKRVTRATSGIASRRNNEKKNHTHRATAIDTSGVCFGNNKWLLMGLEFVLCERYFYSYFFIFSRLDAAQSTHTHIDITLEERRHGAI